MHYVKQFHINGVDTKQVACIELHGKPNAATEGYVGVLGIDMVSPLHDVYKCVAVNGSIYTWELLSSGLSIMSATINGEGVENVQFPYASINKPETYVIKIGDLILDRKGYLYQINALNSTYCTATYSGTQIIAEGDSAYEVAVKNGFEGSVDDWLRSLKGETGDSGVYIGTEEPTDPNVNVWVNPEGDATRTTGGIANALVGNASGEVVAMDDVSPLEHKMPVKVRSKNLIPYPYETKTTTISGVTFTDNGDGTITLSGTATEDIIFTPITSKNAFYIDSGTYTFGSDIVGDHSGIYLQGKLIEDDSISIAPIDAKSKTFTLTESMRFRFNVRIAAGTNCDNVVIKPQLEKDTTASAFTPYIADNTEVTVKSCGKNLFNINQDILSKHYAITVQRDVNDIILTLSTPIMTTLASCPIYFLLPNCLEGKAITINYDTKTSGINTSQVRIHWMNSALKVTGGSLIGEEYSGQTAKNMTLSGVVPQKPDDEHNILCLMLYAHGSGRILEDGTVYTTTFSNLQLELNTVATPKEAYIEGEEITTTLAEGAELTSIAPNMTIYTDKEGAIVECSYNKDTNIVIEKLTQAIISLGGSV